MSTTLADNIVSYRDLHGRFESREELKKVPRLGERTFEQAAGFLRVVDGSNPLDASAVHPEAYPVVEKLLQISGRDIKQIIGDSGFLQAVNASQFVDPRFGLPTVNDILRELEKPGRDPRPAFQAPVFDDAITEIADLKPGMVLEGVVTNVTAFGAFVDIGVHQDGLVHISVLADRFVKDPHEVVKAGDIIRVKVVDVDAARKRIALSCRLKDDNAPASSVASAKGKASTPKAKASAPIRQGTLGDLLRKAGV